jgi:hypothetical protein
VALLTAALDFPIVGFSGQCAVAFHPLCARGNKLRMEIASREDSEEVRQGPAVILLSGEMMRIEGKSSTYVDGGHGSVAECSDETLCS